MLEVVAKQAIDVVDDLHAADKILLLSYGCLPAFSGMTRQLLRLNVVGIAACSPSRPASLHLNLPES
ncbi:MAG: hypothetical protein ACK5YZ_01315 [bacterium]